MAIGEQIIKLVSMGVVHGQYPAIVNVMTNDGGIVSGTFNTYIITINDEGINLYDISVNDQYNKKGDIKILFSEMAHAEVQTANMGITKYLVIYLKNRKWVPLIFNYRARDYEPQKNNITNIVDFITNYQFE